jgi:hypothetical protein
MRKRRPALISFVNSCPEIFKKSCVIGAYDGSHFTFALINDKIDCTVYENFSDMEESEIPFFKKLYDEWRSFGLKVSYEDGFKECVKETWTFLKTEIPPFKIEDFLKQNDFSKTVIAINGYGSGLRVTHNICDAIDNGFLYPIAKYADYVFFTTSEEYRKDRYDYIKSKLDEIKYKYHVKHYRYYGYLDLQSWYAMILEEKEGRKYES